MAFATKFKTSVKDWNGDTITAYIQKDGFSGSVQEFEATGGSPIVIEHQTNVNEKEAKIIPSQARITVYVNYDWDLIELLYATDREYKVVIENDTESKELFVGWVLSGVNSEEYYTGQYQVTIQATDGLADLKTTPYLNSGDLYDEFQTPFEIIQNCLSNTGLSGTNLYLWENTDIYAASGMTVPTYPSTNQYATALKQSYIHTRAYGDSVDDVMSCWDVLSAICQAFYCRILQGTSLTGNSCNFILSKIDKIGSTEYYRQFQEDGTANNLDNFSPLLTMGTDVNHVNGRARLGIKQAYKEVNLTANRGAVHSLLNGTNFASGDFNGGTGALDDWGNTAAVFGNYSGGMTVTTDYREATADSGETVLEIDGVGVTAYKYKSVLTPGSSRTNFTLDGTTGHSFATGDRVLIWGGDDQYGGVARVNGTGVDGLGNDYITCDITYQGTAEATGWVAEIDDCLKVDQRLVYYGETDELTDDDFLEITVRAKTSIATGTPERLLPLGIYCNLGTGSTDDTYRQTTDSNGAWWNAELAEFSTGDTDQVILCRNLDTDFKEYTFTINLAEITTSGTSYEIYLAIFQPLPLYGTVQIDSIKIQNISRDNKTNTTSIDSDYVESLELDFFHTDGDGTDNEEYKYNRPILDDASPKKFINSWQQDGGTADNLEDIIEANLASSYGDNSQIWTGTLKGDILPYNSIKDPLNFDRVFQLQRISRDLVSKFNAVSMIEIDPAGEPSFNLSVATSPSSIEFTKGTSNTEVKYITITNDGNTQLSLNCSITSENHSNYFSIIGETTFTLDVGKSKTLGISTDEDIDPKVCVGYLTIDDTRSYRTMTAVNVQLAHFNSDYSRYLFGYVSPGDITTVMGGGTVNVDTLGGTPCPTSKPITSIITSSIPWRVSVTGTSTNGTMQVEHNAVNLETQTVTAPTDDQTISINYFGYAMSNGWDGDNIECDFV